MGVIYYNGLPYSGGGGGSNVSAAFIIRRT
jgi:hypothetical protein